MQSPGFDPQVGKMPWRREWLPTPVFLGFPGGSAGKESAGDAGDMGLIPGLGRSPGEVNTYPLQCSGLENSMDCIVQGVAKSGTRLSNFHTYTHTHILCTEYPVTYLGVLPPPTLILLKEMCST